MPWKVLFCGLAKELRLKKPTYLYIAIGNTYITLCVTPLPWNETEQNWETIKNRLQEVFDKALRQDIHSLHTQLKEQLRDFQTLEEQKVLTDLKNYLTWVNPKNWFSGINLQVWVFYWIRLSSSDIFFDILSCPFQHNQSR